MSTLAENLRMARRFNGWTQEQLAERAGVSQTTIDKIEQGKTLRSRLLPNIALALNVPPEDLDPALAKAKKEWNERLKNNPQNFYVRKTQEELPMYSISFYGEECGADIFALSDEPMHSIPAPRLLDGARSLCIYWDSDLMSPEIERGDAAFFEIGGAIYAGKTGLFMSDRSNLSLCFIARLVMADEDNWTVRFLKSNTTIKLSTKDWPSCAPMRVRYCNDPGEHFR